MIDDIVEMIMKEARARDNKNLFASVFSVIEDVFNKIFSILLEHRLEERRKEVNENKG